MCAPPASRDGGGIVNLQNARHAVFLEVPPQSEADKLQAQGRVVRLSDRTRSVPEVVFWGDTCRLLGGPPAPLTTISPQRSIER